MTTLVIFDVDGTLLRSRLKSGQYIGGTLFARCFEEHFGVSGVSDDSKDYTHQTDSCWTDEAHRKHVGREAERHEIDAFWSHYMNEWEDLAGRDVEFLRIGGAESIFERLAALGMHIAIASGGLRRMQEFKLERTGFDFRKLPAAYADDGYSREDITRAAAGQFEGIKRTVYIGDAWWDVQSCRALGMPFIGMGHRHEMLLEHGATHALPDYTNEEAFLEAVADCGAP